MKLGSKKARESIYRIIILIIDAIKIDNFMEKINEIKKNHQLFKNFLSKKKSPSLLLIHYLDK